MNKKLLIIALLAIAPVTVHAKPIKIQYRLGAAGQVFTGWLEHINFNSDNVQIETGAGFGFTPEIAPYPAEDSVGNSFAMSATDVAFLFGIDWLSTNMTLKYNASTFESYTYRVNQIGLRNLNDSHIIFFDLAQ